MTGTTIALVGLPNSGKTTLFNAITGSRQRVANFPGITVEQKIGEFEHQNTQYKLVDLPGIYTLDANSLDEKVSRDYILDRVQTDSAELLVLVMDSTNLKKSLYLALQLKDLGQNFIVALNMMDQAKRRGLELSLERLEESLGVKVIPTVAVDDDGLMDLQNSIALAKEGSSKNESKFEVPIDLQKKIKQPDYIKEKFFQVDEILKNVVVKKIRPDSFSETIDSFILHPFYGPVVLMLTLLVMFQTLFAWADPFVGMIESMVDWLSVFMTDIIPAGDFRSLVVDGIIAGVGGVIVFLPHICFMFIMVILLEDIGYLGRAAFLLDHVMRRLGLPGKAVVPMLSSHACAIPGIMAARIIDNPKERLLTMMISPLMSCSARLPVYALLIAAIVPDKKVLGIFGLPGLVLFALYMFGIFGAFLVAFITKKTALRHSPSYLLMELPPYRAPRVKNILYGTINKAKIFLKKAGTIILILSMLIWALMTYPKAPENADQPSINYSAAAMVGKTIAPVFSPLGFDWKISTALIPSFAAREVLVSAMGTVMAVEETDDEEAFSSNLSQMLASKYSLGSLLALLVWFVFAPQCIATFGVMRRETGGLKMPLIFGMYTLVLSYFFSFLTYAIVRMVT